MKKRMNRSSKQVTKSETKRKIVDELLKNRSLSDEKSFIGGLTAQEYLSLSERERDKLWDKWYKEAEKETKKIKEK